MCGILIEFNVLITPADYIYMIFGQQLASTIALPETDILSPWPHSLILLYSRRQKTPQLWTRGVISLDGLCKMEIEHGGRCLQPWS